MSWWQHWLVGQVDASVAAGVLFFLALAGRRRLSPEIRSGLILLGLIRLALPPWIVSPWTDAFAELPLLDDGRFVVADLLERRAAMALPIIAGVVSVAFAAAVLWRSRLAAQRWIETTDPAPSQLQDRVDELARIGGLTHPPELRVSRIGDGPLATGLRATSIVIPRSAVDVLDAEAMDAVLAHEVAHHANRDLWLLALSSGLRVIVWFNPLAHLGFRLLTSAREDAADDWAIANAAGDGSAYCEALLRSARLASSPAGVGSVGAHPIGRRLRRLFDPRTRRSARMGALTLGVLALLGAACLPGARGVQFSLEDEHVAIASIAGAERRVVRSIVIVR